MIGTILFAIFVTIASYVYVIEKKKENYWNSKGVPQVKYKPFLGILWDYGFSRNLSLGHVFKKIYDDFPNERYVGCLTGNTRNLVLRDPGMFQYVLRTEFNSFHSKGASLNWEVDKLADNVLFMEGTRWKLMRQRLTPVFTSGKLRNMFNIMNDSGKEINNFVEQMCQQRHKYSLMNVITTFTASSIGDSVLGINANPGTDLDSPLHKMAREANSPSLKANLNFVIASLFQPIFRLLKIKLFGDHEKFFINLVKRVLKERKKSGITRHDFVDNCLDIQKDKMLRDTTTGYEMETTDELMAGQAFFFFIAGVDPTATAINFALYELSKNPDVLETLHREIDDVFEENEHLTYDIVDKMEYIEKVISESLRMYPPIPNIQRRCVHDHTLPNGIVLEKDVIVTVPILGVHRDPKFYYDPDIFDPERFSAEAIKERPNYTYLPFGEGNRTCIGMRYAKLQIKTGLIHLLRKFTVKPAGDDRAPKYVKSFFSLRSDNLNYTFVPRQI